MAEADETLAKLQTFVDGFAMDVGRVRAAVDDESTPPGCRAILVGALNYLLDRLDMFPDHFKGLGFADDAMVLRLAAAQAVAEGAGSRGLFGLAKEAASVNQLAGELEAPLAKLIAALPDRVVRGRTAKAILASKDERAVFDADLNRAVKKFEVSKIDVSWMGAGGLVNELRKMMRHALTRDGFLKE